MADWFKWLRPNSKSNKELPTKEQVQQGKMPVHIAIIMDGNGRWAQKRGLPRIMGHKAGADAIRDIVRFCGETGIRMLTLYAFSTENWNRPKDEVQGLMNLLLEYLEKETAELHKNEVKIRFLGSLDVMPPVIYQAIRKAEEYTHANMRLELNIALNYGSRSELVRAMKLIAEKYKNGQIDRLDDITEVTISEHLFTAGMPDPDLIIRPGKEMRLSNFLLWQSAYAEFWSTEVLWPDFKPKHLLQAIYDFQGRDRRFGSVKMKAGGDEID